MSHITRRRSTVTLTLLLCMTLGFPAIGLSSERTAAAFSATGSLGDVAIPDAEQPLTLVLFWATWCPYCKQLMPHLQSILDQYPDAGIRVLALSIKDDGDPAEYLQERGFEFNLISEADDIAKSYMMVGVPGVILIDDRGKVLFDLRTLQASERRAAADQTDSHWKKAARLAPWWAAELRQVIDAQIAEDR